MGTTLTGTTPQDTYDSLIKVTDNGPLSGTAKYLSDGLGNDSALALGLTQVGIGTNTLFTTASIAASLPATSIGASFNAGMLNLQNTSTANGNLSLIGFQDANAFINLAALGAINTTHSASPNSVVGELGFYTKPSGVNVVQERMRITSAGNVGIGTSSPPADTNLAVLGNFQSGFYRNVTSGDRGYFLHLGANTASGTLTNAASLFGTLESGDANGSLAIQTRSGGTLATRVRIDADGLKFGSDTAAANALDDYEEGTWTLGVTFGGAAVGVTTSNNTGTYTKIGRQVTVNGYLSLTNKGSSAGSARITGLPFTVPNSVGNYSSATLWFYNISFANQYQAYGIVNTTTISLNEITDAGVFTDLTNADFANDSEIMVSLTYFA
jgi:hypothetical protein